MLFGDDEAALPAEPQGFEELGVGDGVELLLDFALNVRFPGGPGDVEQARPADVAVYHFGRDGEIAYQARELPGGLGKPLLLIQNELFERPQTPGERRRSGRNGHKLNLKKRANVATDRLQTEAEDGKRVFEMRVENEAEANGHAQLVG